MTDDTARADRQSGLQLIDRVALRHEIAEYGIHQRAAGDSEIVLRLIDRAPVVVAAALAADEPGLRCDFDCDACRAEPDHD